MSLDVYLTMKEPVVRRGTGVFVRDNGATRELSAEEVAERFPGSEIPEEEYESEHCYSGNITHNMGEMAGEAGIYLALWRPGEMLAPEVHAAIQAQAQAKNWHDAGGVFELEKTLPTVYARDLIEPLEKGLELLRSDPPRFKAFNSPNGWGMYEHFVPFVAEYLEACKEYPGSEVRVSR